MPPELVEEFEQQQLQMSQKLVQPSAQSPNPGTGNSEKEVFPPDIEGPANGYFQVRTLLGVVVSVLW